METNGLEMDVRCEPDRLILGVRGDVDMMTAPHLLDAICVAGDLGVTEAVVDLKAVEFMDSSGLNALVTAERRLRGTGLRLRVIDPTPQVLTVMRVTGLDRYLHVRTDADHSTFERTPG